MYIYAFIQLQLWKKGSQIHVWLTVEVKKMRDTVE